MRYYVGMYVLSIAVSGALLATLFLTVGVVTRAAERAMYRKERSMGRH